MDPHACARAIQRRLLVSGLLRHPVRFVAVAVRRRRYARGAAASGMPLHAPAPPPLVAAPDHSLRAYLWAPPFTATKELLPTAVDTWAAWRRVLTPWAEAETHFRTLNWNASIQRESGSREPRGEWEIHRLQGLLLLARAGAAGRSDAIRRAIELLDEWVPLAMRNEVPAWESPMEVGLRLVTLIAASGLLVREPRFGAWWNETGAALVDVHARWLEHRVEDDSVRPSNHATANIAALVCHAAVRSNGAQLRRWVRRLTTIASLQIHPDGGQFERSTGYHRYVLEALLYAIHAAESRGLSVPVLRRHAQRAGHFMAAVGDPLPLIGDHDGSQFVQPYAFGSATASNWWRALYVTLFPGDEEALRPPEVDVRPHFGLATLRRGFNRITLSSGVGGQDGRGGHVHDDQLSLTLTVADVPWIVDPGTSGYLYDPDARVLERSARLHSTAMVGEEETYPICRSAPFALPQRGECSIRGSRDSIAGVHVPRGRRAMVRHERVVQWTSPDLLAIDDYVEARLSASVITVRWHLGGRWVAEPVEGGVRLRRGGDVLLLNATWPKEVLSSDAWYAPGFGVRMPSTLVEMRSHPGDRFRLRTYVQIESIPSSDRPVRRATDVGLRR